MTTALYFHGFASSPRSRKVEILRELLEPEGIELNAPDLNIPAFGTLDFDAIAALGEAEARRLPPGVVVGSSLGALVALSVSRSIPGIPLVLIAPALGMHDQWLARLPAGDPISVHHHAYERSLPIHRAFFERMATVGIDRDPPAAKVTVIMGSNDESVPFERVLTTWRSWEDCGGLPTGSSFVEITGGDHSLTAHAETIAREIVRAARG